MTRQIDLQQFQANLPHYLKQVAAGDTLVICQNNLPVAEVGPVKTPRPLGLGQGQGQVLTEFFDPLPEEIVQAFEGKTP